jgi:DNA-binding LacI/PurR family transcriptional regulator
VSGFDDHPLSALVQPGLTAVSWDTPAAAAAAATLLLGPPAERRRQVVMTPVLVARDSTGPAPVRPIA